MESAVLTFGDRLRTEREKRDVSLDDVAASTRIRRSYLEALERNDFDDLPGAVFNRGFVRAYAEYLGMDPDPLLLAYAREVRVRTPEGTEAEVAPLDELRRVLAEQASTPRAVVPVRAAVVGGVVLTVVAAGAVAAWFLLRSPADSAPVLAAAPPEPTPVEAAVADSLPLPEPVVEKTEPVAAATPAPAPPEPAAVATDAGLTVPEAGVGTRVVNRALVGRGDRFAAGSELCFWTRVVGGAPGDHVEHVWLHEGRVTRVFELPVNASHWRTYSRHTVAADLTGNWVVEARDDAGRVLAREAFVVD